MPTSPIQGTPASRRVIIRCENTGTGKKTSTGKKTPGGAGTHTGTRTHRRTSQPSQPTNAPERPVKRHRGEPGGAALPWHDVSNLLGFAVAFTGAVFKGRSHAPIPQASSGPRRIMALVRVAAGLPGGSRRARIGPFGL